jgi:hypothetical protein
MLESLQRGEGVPQVDVILNKRRAQIDDAVDDYDDEVAADAAAGGADAARRPYVDYRPEREEINPFLADDDDDDRTATPVVRAAAKSAAVDDDVRVSRVSCVCRVFYAWHA